MPNDAEERSKTPSVDRARIMAAVVSILEAVGEDPTRTELLKTPGRVADAYTEFFSGVGVDAAQLLGETFAFEGANPPEPVLVRGVSFRSICEHHLLPFVGTAHIAYVPNERLVGLGRFSAVVDALASRPQLQERLGEQIADTLQSVLDAAGVLVVLDASHNCVTTRGPRETGSTTVTVASRGSLGEPTARAELMALIAMGSGAPAAEPTHTTSTGVAL